MRILFWSSTFWPSIGGVQVLAAKLLPALEERGYEHIVVTPQSRDEQLNAAYYKGIPIHRFPFWHSMVNIDQLVQVRQQVAELKRTFAPDLIHINAVSRSDFFHHLTAHVHSAPVVVTLHGGWSPEANMIVERTLRNATWVVGCSEATLNEGRQLVPEMRPCSSVIHNGLEVPPLQPMPLSFNPPRLLCLGRLVEDKGFDVALGALALLVERFPQVCLTIAGDGPARADLELQASRLGILQAVQFTGWVDPEKIPELVNTASVVVMPSRWQEPFGLVALEAALMARPVVATRVGGLPEVVVHNQTGFLVEKENSQALAEAIAFLLEHPTTATQMGQTGRTRALEQFGWDRYVDAYDTLYRRLVTWC
jgi:glycogen(starch) synthase